MEYKVIGGSFSPRALEQAPPILRPRGWRIVAAFLTGSGIVHTVMLQSAPPRSGLSHYDEESRLNTHN